MQLFAITIATISLVQSAAIPSTINPASVPDKIIDDVLAGIQADEEQEPDWLIEFNKYLDDDVLEFDFDSFMSEMSDNEIEEFFDFLTIMLADTAQLIDDDETTNENFQV